MRTIIPGGILTTNECDINTDASEILARLESISSRATAAENKLGRVNDSWSGPRATASCDNPPAPTAASKRGEILDGLDALSALVERINDQADRLSSLA